MSSHLPAQKRPDHQVSLLDALPPPSSPTRPGSPILIYSRSEGSLAAENGAPLWTGEESAIRRLVTSIDALPDDVLLGIFKSYGYDDPFGYEREKAWQTLVHLVCTTTTPARNMLNIWPALPLVIVSHGDSRGSIDNLIPALECIDRVCHIILMDVLSSDLEIFLAAMQQPSPGLRHLQLWSDDEIDETVAVVPDSFLGGSAPRLEWLQLDHIPFPGLPKLLLSATHLVTLRLFNIPHSGYFSPEAMVTALSTLTSLEYLSLKFESPRSCPDPARRRTPPETRAVLPALTHFSFKGVCEYLDCLVACIDTPQLNILRIIFFNDIIFDTPQFMQFISRTPMPRAPDKAHITLQDRATGVSFSSQTSRDWEFSVEILCKGLDWQVSSLEQVCTSFPSPVSILEDLYFYEDSDSLPDWKDSIENRQCLELFRSFMAVKNLYLSENFASLIAPVLQELVEGRTPDVLPALQNIFLKGLESSGYVQDSGSIGKLVAARQAANHPIVISPWTV